MNLKLDNDKYKLLEHSYLCQFSNEIPKEISRDYKLILEYKLLLKECRPSKQILSGLIDTIYNLIIDKKKFQKETLIKILRHHLLSELLDEEMIDKLFFIFRELILEVNDDLAWSVSFLIKDINLKQEHIDWLIENQDISEHVINRLLRYPISNQVLANWAKTCIKNNILTERLSELVSLILNIDKNYCCSDLNAQLWGIHYSKINDELKKELLSNFLTVENLEEFIKICERNNYYDLISAVYVKFNN